MPGNSNPAKGRCYDGFLHGEQDNRDGATGVDYRAFLPCCARAVEPSDAKELFERGQRELATANYTDAERDFDRLLEMGLRTAPVYTNLGVIYLRTGKLDRAVSVLKKAKELAPGMTGIDLNLGLAYYRQREYQQAERYFATVLSAEPANVQARYLKGVCHFMMDQFEAAIAAFSPIQQAEQSDLEYLFMLGISYGKVKRTTEAQSTFARLMDAGGETPHLHLLLGKAYLALEDYQKAQTELEKAAADGSKLPYAHYYLGVLYEKQGKFDAAATEFAGETEISPNDHWAYEDLTRIRLDQGDPDGAILLLEKAVSADSRLGKPPRGAGQGIFAEIKTGTGDPVPQARDPIGAEQRELPLPAWPCLRASRATARRQRGNGESPRVASRSAEGTDGVAFERQRT